MTIDRNRHTPSVTSKLDLVAGRLRDLFGVPERKRTLPDPLDLLVATVLSQNTNDINSHSAFVNLKGSFPDLRKLAGVQPARIERLIRVGGIAKKKSRTIRRLVKEILGSFRRFDRRELRSINRDELIEKLRGFSGVGFKTASCVSLFALGDDDAFPVDTHVHRVLNRIGVVGEKTPDKTYLAVRDRIPAGKGYEIHINLIRFGRKVCTAVKPRCWECPLNDVCRWPFKTPGPPERDSVRDERRVRFMLLEKV